MLDELTVAVDCRCDEGCAVQHMKQLTYMLLWHLIYYIAAYSESLAVAVVAAVGVPALRDALTDAGAEEHANDRLWGHCITNW